VPSLGRAKYWQDGEVYRTLTNRACVGEMVPMRRGEDGRRVQAGPTVKDYFPRVVSDETFALAQEAIRLRTKGTGTGGRLDGSVVNLFRGLLQSPAGVPYTFCERKGYRYLVLKPARTGGAEPPNVPYFAFEGVLLRWVVEVNVDLSRDEDELEVLQAQEHDLDRRLTAIRRELRKHALDDSLPSLVQVCAELEAELKATRERIELAAVPRSDPVSQARSLIAQLAEAAGDAGAVKKLRLRLRQQFRGVLERVVVVDVTGKPRTANKSYTFDLEFTNGQTRRLFFDTDRKGVTRQGLIVEAGEEQGMAGVVQRMAKRESKNATFTYTPPGGGPPGVLEMVPAWGGR
jgi:hypothetical protein